MFKPKFGANPQHFKVEIGGGENGTCGSEPTPALTREELANPVPHGFEVWLMAEARKRNPQIGVTLKSEDMLGTVDGKKVTRVKYEGYLKRMNGLAYLSSSYDPTVSTTSA